MSDKVKIPLFSFFSYAFIEVALRELFGPDVSIEATWYTQVICVIASITVGWFVNEELKEATDFDWTPKNKYDRMMNLTLYGIGYITLACFIVLSILSLNEIYTGN